MKGMDLLEAQTGLRRTAYVGGRGYGKTAALEAMRASIGPLDVGEPLTVEKLREMVAFLTPTAAQRAAMAAENERVYQAVKAGANPWAYTPADELRDRLNTQLRGKQPMLAVNTRYWRNL